MLARVAASGRGPLSPVWTSNDRSCAPLSVGGVCARPVWWRVDVPQVGERVVLAPSLAVGEDPAWQPTWLFCRPLIQLRRDGSVSPVGGECWVSACDARRAWIPVPCAYCPALHALFDSRERHVATAATHCCVVLELTRQGRERKEVKGAASVSSVEANAGTLRVRPRIPMTKHDAARCHNPMT